MTGLGHVVGLGLGIGVFCCWWACWPRPARRTAVRRSRARLLIEDELRQAGFGTVRPLALVACCLGAGVLSLLLMLAFSHSPPIASCFALVGGWAPWLAIRVRARRRRIVLRELWPDAVDHLASGIRAGLSLPEALGQLSDRGPEPLRPAFASFAEDYRATGRFSDCLDRLKAELADPVADRIVEALRLTREVGGHDLGTLLRTLSGFLRDDARTRSELEARQSWTVNAARLAVAAPWIVLALLASRPEAVAAYNTPAGVIVLAIGGGVSLVAYRVMMRLGRLPEEARVLR